MDQEDEKMEDKPKKEVSLAENQFRHLIIRNATGFISKRMLFQLTMRHFYSQLKEGCNDGKKCQNKFCHHNIEVELTHEECSKKSIELSKGAFEKHFYFCKPLSYYYPSCSDFGATGLTLGSIKSAIESCKTIKNFNYLENLVSLFGYSDCLDASFETVHDVKNNLDLKNSSGIDFDGLETAYKTLLDGKFQGFDSRKTLISHISKNSLYCSKNSSSFQSLLEMRKVLICFLAPFLQSDLTIVQNLIRASISLPFDFRDALTNWITEVPMELFKRMILSVQQFLTMRLYSEQMVDDYVAYAVRCLNIFDKSNEKRSRMKKVNCKFFYNEPLNESLLMKLEYKRWIQRRGNNSNGLNSFSVLDYPFIFEPSKKREVLSLHNNEMKSREVNHTIMSAIFNGTDMSPYCVVKVDRRNLILSTLNSLERIKQRDLKKPLKVHFYGEEGVDEGGVQKEAFSLLIKELFDPKYGMFKSVEGHSYWFNLDSQDLREFTLIGQLIGLAIYNKIVLDIHFPLVVYKKLLGIKVGISDMDYIDPGVSNSLLQTLEYKGDDFSSVFGFTMSVDYVDGFEQEQTVDLVPNGRKIEVTQENKEKFVELYVDWHLNKSIEKQFDAFKKGFFDVVSMLTIKLFKPEELELVVCGSRDLDFEQLEKNCIYEGFTEDDKIVKEFWNFVKNEMDTEQKHKFLMFCTGSDRVPIGGLGKLRFILMKNGDDDTKLPSSRTCFNIFLMPDYSNAEVMKKNIFTALDHGTIGFGLQ